jgi:hypothetical protein
MELPSDAQLMAMVREEVALWSTDNIGAKVQTNPQTFKKLIKNLRGLNL